MNEHSKPSVDPVSTLLGEKPEALNLREALIGALTVLELIAANRKGELMSNVETRHGSFVNVIDTILACRRAIDGAAPPIGSSNPGTWQEQEEGSLLATIEAGTSPTLDAMVADAESLGLYTTGAGTAPIGMVRIDADGGRAFTSVATYEREKFPGDWRPCFLAGGNTTEAGTNPVAEGLCRMNKERAGLP